MVPSGLAAGVRGISGDGVATVASVAVSSVGTELLMVAVAEVVVVAAVVMVGLIP